MFSLFIGRFGSYILIGIVALLALGLGVQTLRIGKAKLEFAEYKVAQQEEIQRQIDLANKKRKESADEYRKVKKQLEVSIASGEVLKRCVAAGKCGVQHYAASSDSKGISAATRANAARAVAISAGREPAEEVVAPEVVIDCARTTLQLNMLQTDIERQEGYASD